MEFHPGFFIFGAVFFIVAVLILIGELKKRKKYTQTVKAELVMYFTQVDTDGETGSKTTVHHPIMRYCVSGKWYEGRNDTCWNKEKYPIGEFLDIMYDPEHPEKFRFPGDNTAMISSIVGIILGIALMVLSFILK